MPSSPVLETDLQTPALASLTHLLEDAAALQTPTLCPVGALVGDAQVSKARPCVVANERERQVQGILGRNSCCMLPTLLGQAGSHMFVRAQQTVTPWL